MLSVGLAEGLSVGAMDGAFPDLLLLGRLLLLLLDLLLPELDFADILLLLLLLLLPVFPARA